MASNPRNPFINQEESAYLGLPLSHNIQLPCCPPFVFIWRDDLYDRKSAWLHLIICSVRYERHMLAYGKPPSLNRICVVVEQVLFPDSRMHISNSTWGYLVFHA